MYLMKIRQPSWAAHGLTWDLLKLFFNCFQQAIETRLNKAALLSWLLKFRASSSTFTCNLFFLLFLFSFFRGYLFTPPHSSPFSLSFCPRALHPLFCLTDFLLLFCPLASSPGPRAPPAFFYTDVPCLHGRCTGSAHSPSSRMKFKHTEIPFYCNFAI